MLSNKRRIRLFVTHAEIELWRLRGNNRHLFSNRFWVVCPPNSLILIGLYWRRSRDTPAAQTHRERSDKWFTRWFQSNYPHTFIHRLTVWEEKSHWYCTVESLAPTDQTFFSLTTTLTLLRSPALKYLPMCAPAHVQIYNLHFVITVRPVTFKTKLRSACGQALIKAQSSFSLFSEADETPHVVMADNAANKMNFHQTWKNIIIFIWSCVSFHLIKLQYSLSF